MNIFISSCKMIYTACCSLKCDIINAFITIFMSFTVIINPIF